MAQAIYKEYVDSNGMHCVNLDSATVAKTKALVASPTAGSFDDAQVRPQPLAIRNGATHTALGMRHRDVQTRSAATCLAHRARSQPLHCPVKAIEWEQHVHRLEGAQEQIFALMERDSYMRFLKAHKILLPNARQPVQQELSISRLVMYGTAPIVSHGLWQRCVRTRSRNGWVSHGHRHSVPEEMDKISENEEELLEDEKALDAGEPASRNLLSVNADGVEHNGDLIERFPTEAAETPNILTLSTCTATDG